MLHKEKKLDPVAVTPQMSASACAAAWLSPTHVGI